MDTLHSTGRAGSYTFMPSQSTFSWKGELTFPLLHPPHTPSSLQAPLDSYYLLDVPLHLDCRADNYNAAGWLDERPVVT